MIFPFKNNKGIIFAAGRHNTYVILCHPTIYAGQLLSALKGSGLIVPVSVPPLSTFIETCG
ncbi:hypothetical protein, partial [Rothia mucilaginosa]|uniref:hypothetical protein n=1 Tax=Rothia mucilaginosa TaxID=43675 RepID=UPI0026EE23EB